MTTFYFYFIVLVHSQPFTYY